MPGFAEKLRKCVVTHFPRSGRGIPEVDRAIKNRTAYPGVVLRRFQRGNALFKPLCIDDIRPCPPGIAARADADSLIGTAPILMDDAPPCFILGPVPFRECTGGFRRPR